MSQEENSAHSFTEGSETEQAAIIDANQEPQWDEKADSGVIEGTNVETSEEEPLKSEEEELKEFLASYQNRQHALQLAEQIQSVCGDKWFTLEKLVKKSSETKQSAFQKIKLCEMFGLMITRIGDHRDGRELIRQSLFKVVISEVDRIDALERIITYHQGQIEKMTIERNLLIDSLKSEAKNEQ